MKYCLLLCEAGYYRGLICFKFNLIIKVVPWHMRPILFNLNEIIQLLV